MRIKISRKEAKETAYWLQLIVETNTNQFEKEGKFIFDEAIQLKKILCTILQNNNKT